MLTYVESWNFLLPHDLTWNACVFQQVNDALAKGARRVVGSGAVTDANGKGRFYSPTLLVDVDDSMIIMKEESFGPIVGVQKVKSDREAVEKINDSAYGLTASVFTPSRERALALGSQISAGTVYMNRCDVLDPYLPWTGVRDTGKGISLSKHGFRAVTKLKAVRFGLLDEFVVCLQDVYLTSFFLLSSQWNFRV